MRAVRFAFGTVAVLAVAVSSASAQVIQGPSAIVVTRGDFSVSPYFGYMVGEQFVKGPLNTGLGAVAAPMYGVQASFPLAPSASLVGTIGYSSGDLEVGVPILGGVSVGNTNTWVFDAAVELRAESWARKSNFIPIAQLGGGAIRREVGVLSVSAKTTDFMVSGGIGADIPMSSNVSLRLMAKDYFGKADFGTVGPLTAKTKDLHTLGLTGGLRISF
jgi:hypothetical protein